MSETTVSFLTEVVNGQTSTYPVSTRVFSSAIAATSLSYYTAAIETLQKTMAGEKWENGQWVTPTPPMSPDEQRQIIQNVIKFLNTWSQMKIVSGGVEGFASNVTPTPAGRIYVEGLQGSTSSDNSFTLTGLDASNLGSLGAYVSNSSLTVTSTMNRYMGESIDQTIRTFRAAGWDPTTSISYTDVRAVNGYSALTNDSGNIYNISTVLQSAYNVIKSAQITGNAFSQSTSIQQILMTDYVITGNAMLYEQMGALQQAINMNQQALSYLNSLQDLMNQKSPQNFIMQLQYLTTSNPQYAKFEQDTFGQTLSNIPKFTANDVSNYVALVSSGQQGGYPSNALFTGDQSLANPTGNPPVFYLNGLASGSFISLSALNQSSTVLKEAYAGTVDQIISNLQYLQNQLASISDASPLSQQLSVLIKDFQGLPGYTPGTSSGDLTAWVKDFTNANQGTYQTHLNNAVTASQSLNDTARENLQEAMFVYQEFYQSATSMLSDLHQLLQTMAQNIGR